MDTPRFSLTLKPTFWIALKASLLITFVLNWWRQLILLAVIIVIAFTSLLIIFPRQEPLGLAHGEALLFLSLTCIGLPSLIPLIIFGETLAIIIKMYSFRKLILGEVNVDFFDDYLISKREGVEGKMEYKYFKQGILIGDFLFQQHTNKLNGYLYLGSYDKKQELIDFLQGKYQKGIKKIIFI